MQKRSPEVVVISDVHLGTYGCHAAELLHYLRSINPRLLVINGDFIDIWNFSKRYFPASHLEVIKEVMHMVSNGTRVIYITGNHDELLRKYSDMQLGNFTITDKVVMEINGKMVWIFHGDVFDSTTKGSAKMLAKLGGHGYDLLILINRMVNWTLELFGREKMSFSKKVKNGVKKAVKWIGDFEQTAAELAIEKDYDYVICGHIHQPQQRIIETAKGKVTYLNSGDWVENLTSLEYEHGEWKIQTFDTKAFEKVKVRKEKPRLNVVTEEVMLYMHTLAANPPRKAI
ncbi:MAG: UDP-2,3-diacylglucosamine diphosphatase [Chitinophagaceae bacterium]|jgi:UDP-2,3-diacylglucosamine pyrophosphatase LpxH|nr:UDP-2,3-diacylglucosamine diphosphatase [Chitinophagaceae bacterium]